MRLRERSEVGEWFEVTEVRERVVAAGSQIEPFGLQLVTEQKSTGQDWGHGCVAAVWLRCGCGVGHEECCPSVYGTRQS